MSSPLHTPMRPAPPPNPYAPPARKGSRAPRGRWTGWPPWAQGGDRRRETGGGNGEGRPRWLPAGLPRLPWRPLLAGAAGVALLAAAASFAGGFHYQDLASVPLPDGAPGKPAGATGMGAGKGPAGRPAGSRSGLARLERLVAAQRPPGIYIAVDTLANRLYLMRGGEVVREAVCSTGTGGVLEDPASGRRWVFDTPRGTHRVVAKAEHPVWNKPDWAFIEEGQPIPADPAARVDNYSLGDYALYMGDGYIIHGTLYQRLLGRSVTHGCVRLGDEDLEAVFRAAPVGTRVYIY